MKISLIHSSIFFQSFHHTHPHTTSSLYKHTHTYPPPLPPSRFTALKQSHHTQPHPATSTPNHQQFRTHSHTISHKYFEDNYSKNQEFVRWIWVIHICCCVTLCLLQTPACVDAVVLDSAALTHWFLTPAHFVISCHYLKGCFGAELLNLTTEATPEPF